MVCMPCRRTLSCVIGGWSSLVPSAVVVSIPVFSQTCNIEKTSKGVLISIMQTCPCCEHSYEWNSQPHVGKYPASNLHLSAATAFTGSSFLQIQKVMNCPLISTANNKTGPCLQNKCFCAYVNIAQAYSQTQNSTAMLPLAEPTDLEPYNRTQYCHWPCECPPVLPSCPPGVSLLMDGCDCCKACARQAGEGCNEADACDYHKGLYCDYSSDKPRYEKGVCAYMVGTGCEHDGVIYRNGQSFKPSCKYQCLCVNGAIGCVTLCTDSQPPRVWCQNPRRVKIPGRCCEQWICDEPKKGRKTAPRHAVEALPAEAQGQSRNCVIQTTSWSICSKTCGRGLSLRVSNANERCEMVKESRLCNIRPCEVDITKHIKPGKKCLNIYREEQPKNFTISGCVSKQPYRPKYCGVCMATDDRCCIPYKSKTIYVEFVCPNGAVFTWQVMWINACFCNLSCRNPNNIFAELENYYGYPEVVN